MSLPISSFAADHAALLNSQLTIDERLQLVHGIMAIPGSGIAANPPGVAVSAGYIPGIPRLHIPAQRETDASLGVADPGGRRGEGATALPSGLALAASFDPALAYESGRMIGAEARARGFTVMLAGGVNLARDPRNGRNFEYLGEDPLLAGTLAGQSVRGIQSNGIISTVKHFVLNDQESHRHSYDAQIDPASLRESDLLAFELAIETGHPASVMCSYNLLWGRPACGNDALLNGILKGDWHYPFYVMSDWGATDSVEDAADGLDQESGEQLDREVFFDAPLRKAVAEGTIGSARLSDMTGRILAAMQSVGLLERPVGAAPRDESHDAEIARRVEEAGIVLLRNERDVLPLDRSVRRILVVGGHADLGVLSGGGSSQVYPPHFDAAHKLALDGEGAIADFRYMVFQSSSIPAALRARAPGTAVTFDNGRYPGRAAGLAKQADVVIVFANQWMTEDEDAPDLSLPDGQDALVSAVCAANPRCVVVLQTGGAVAMPWLGRTAAVLEAWYGGAGGADAIADILFGTVNPSGRLPVTFPESERQLPRPQIPGALQAEGPVVPEPHQEGADVGYRWFARTQQTPLFPFGYGLSYTHFRYANLRLQGGAGLSATFDVSNTSTRAGVETPQLYLTRAAGRPETRLLGFAKIALQPGETRSVTITAEPRLLARFDVPAHGWRRDAGVYVVAVGPSSAEAALTGEVNLESAHAAP